MNTEVSSPLPSSPPAEQAQRPKCPTCSGVVDPVTGKCPWCATPEVFEPPPPRKRSMRMPTPLVGVLGVIGAVLIIVALLLPRVERQLPVPGGVPVKMTTTNPLSIFLFVPGMFLLIGAGAKHYMESQ